MDFTIARKKGTGAIIWSEDQKRYIEEQYVIYDKTLKELSVEFNVQPQSIRNLLRKQKIQITNKKTCNFPRNSNFFTDIATSEQAYWLGIIYSDGTISKNSNRIALNLKDLEHIEKFRKALGAVNNKITQIKDLRYNKPCYTYMFGLNDKQLHSDLISLGVLPNKSNKLFNLPNLSKSLMPHFVRGYFDGDGSIYFSSNKYILSFVGNKLFLEDLKVLLKKTKLSLCQNSKSKITYDLKICGKKDVSRILHYMYDESVESIRLNRKFKIVQSCLNYLGDHTLEPTNVGCD